MIFGHSGKIKLFKKLADENKLNHAYLFFGENGIGKFFFAKHLAYFLEFGEFELKEEPLLDLKIIKANEKGNIGIDIVHELKNFLWQTPLGSKKRFVIINGAEDLTTEAQSSLLKIVEEPPRDTLLVFIANETQALFPPLLSRLEKIYFYKLAKNEIEKILMENYKVSASKAKTIASDSFGRIGLALEALNKEKKELTENEEFLKSISDKILSLRKENIYANINKISWLLEREVLIKRYNLNPSLQKKAIKYYV